MTVHGRLEVPDSGGGGREIKLEESVGGFFFFSVYDSV